MHFLLHLNTIFWEKEEARAVHRLIRPRKLMGLTSCIVGWLQTVEPL